MHDELRHSLTIITDFGLKLITNCSATRGLLATDHVILNHGHDVDDTRSWHPSPNYHTTPTGGRFSLDRFNVHRCPTRRVFSGTGIELMTCLPWLDTLITGLPQPRFWSDTTLFDGDRG
ncbi:hypothetical protein TNCV_3884771 [Trichonephila clavipes]|nr:hypothetical protein TNCV_3884771 [Trichonephila clavipes]